MLAGTYTPNAIDDDFSGRAQDRVQTVSLCRQRGGNLASFHGGFGAEMEMGNEGRKRGELGRFVFKGEGGGEGEGWIGKREVGWLKWGRLVWGFLGNGGIRRVWGLLPKWGEIGEEMEVE